MNMQSKKRTFVGLISACLLIFSLLLYYLYSLTFHQRTIFNQVFFVALLGVMVMVVLVVFVGLCGILLTAFNYPLYPGWEKVVRSTVNLLYPLVIQLGKLFKIAQDRVQHSFVELNNHLVRIRRVKVEPRRLLLLLPHCLQQGDCGRRITTEVSNCRDCGRCGIGELRRLAGHYGISVKVVTGGTLARQEIKELKPRAIIAVACERDLSSGILEASPLPVLGIINQRPQGPCHNTRVSLAAVEEGIKFFL